MSLNWGGSNYRAVIKRGSSYKLEDGRTTWAERVYPGLSKRKLAEGFAARNGLVMIQNQIGPRNMITSRVDWVILKNEAAGALGLKPAKNSDWDFTDLIREEKYSNDDH